MEASCPSCGTAVDTDETRWCPNCAGYISWDEPEDDEAEASTTRRPGEQDEPPAPTPQDATTVIPTVAPQVPCPSCGTDNPQERSLCQRCGHRLRAETPAPPPPAPPEDTGRGLHPGVLAGLGVAAALVAGVVAVLLVGGDDGAPVAGGDTPAASQEPTANPSPQPSPSVEPTPEQSPTPDGPATPAWVAILRSMEVDAFDRADAESHAATIADEVGRDPQVLLSEDYGSLNPGYWVVYVAGFADQDAADAYCDEIDGIVPDCYARLVE